MSSHVGQGAPGLLRNLSVLTARCSIPRQVTLTLSDATSLLPSSPQRNHLPTGRLARKDDSSPLKVSGISTERLSHLFKATQLNTAETNSKLRQPVWGLSLKMSRLYDRITHKNIEIIKMRTAMLSCWHSFTPVAS